MGELVINEKEELVMKLLHYFITEHNYNPIVLHGGKDEIWLENLDHDYKIVRIVSGYIHNNEQFQFDAFKTKQILKQIKKKTFTFQVPALSIYVNLGENVAMESYDKVECVQINTIKDIDKYDVLTVSFPEIKNKLKTKEKGFQLFSKLTGEINKTNDEKMKQNQSIFSPKKPIVTSILIFINIFIFLVSILTEYPTLIKFGLIPEAVKDGEYFRLFTSMFLHASFTHLLFNMYALYIIGPQIESFFNKIKYIIIYILSGFIGALMSMIFTGSLSVGASGAIFGLLGSLLYFGYHHRLYLGTVIKSQIIPIIIINLLIGFSLSNIDNAAHIGGLLGGVIVSMMVGVEGKDTKTDRINGAIITTILSVFLIYLAFIFIK